MDAGINIGNKVMEEQNNPYGFDLSEENVIRFATGNLMFTVLGFKATSILSTLVATVKVSRHPNLFNEYTFVQSINLYDHIRLDAYCRSSATCTKVNVEDIRKGISALREQLEKYRLDELKNNRPLTAQDTISVKANKEAKAILQSENLIEQIEQLIKKAGLATETKNGLRLFLILLSRHFEKPLHVLLQGSPHLCKILADTVASVIPSNQIHQQTSMSASSMYYTKNPHYWKHKVLHLDFIDKGFKGAITLKEFIENSALKRQTTESDFATRQLYSANKTVAGPICLMAYSEDEELNSRFFQECFLLRVEENEINKAELTTHIKNEYAGATVNSEKAEAICILKEIQRQIKPVKVVIPFANDLELPEGVSQPLRTFSQMLAFIQTISLLNQHKSKIKKDKDGTEYMEATPEHLETALELFKPLLLPRLDLLGQKQRSVLESLKNHIKDEGKKFRLPELPRPEGFGQSTFYRYFDELKRLGYIVKVGGNQKKGIEYKVARWDDYVCLQSVMATLDVQLKKIMERSLSGNSRKFLKTEKSSNTQENQLVQDK